MKVKRVVVASGSIAVASCVQHGARWSAARNSFPICMSARAAPFALLMNPPGGLTAHRIETQAKW
jgi:hypothetical protein